MEMLVVANWKMNPRTIEEARQIYTEIKRQVQKSNAEVVIAAPYPFIAELAKGKNSIANGAQDVSSEPMGPYTGEASASMLKSIGVSYVIVGHSERRARGESDVFVAKKTGLALKFGLQPIICVGERERDQSGKYFGFVENQIRSAFQGISGGKIASCVIAYEPIWAISTSTPGARPATADDAHEMVLFIRKVLTDLYGRSHASKVRILYGGSVSDKNIESLVAGSGAQGFLVGGASLRPREFGSIVKASYVR